MKYFIKLLGYLLSVHCVALLFFSLFRLLFWFCLSHQLPAEAQEQFSLCFPALLRGLWFDNVIVCYASILPLLVGGVLCVIARLPKWYTIGTPLWYSIVYFILFICESANIPFYQQFGKVLNVVVWNWLPQVTTTAGLIFTETSFFVYIAFFVLLYILFIVFVIKISERFRKIQKDSERFRKIQKDSER